MKAWTVVQEELASKPLSGTLLSEERCVGALRTVLDAFRDVREEVKAGQGLHLVDGLCLHRHRLVVHQEGRTGRACRFAGRVEADLHDALVVVRGDGAGRAVVVGRVGLVAGAEDGTGNHIQRIASGYGLAKCLDIPFQVAPVGGTAGIESTCLRVMLEK